MPTRDVSIARYFADLPDPRIDRMKKHSLGDILAIARCAVICGADSWEEVEAFGEAKHDWLRRSLALPNGIPSHDTFGRVFARLDSDRFGECVAGWMGAACEAAGLRHVAIDGKAVRSAPRDTFSGCLHLVSAWAAENRLIMGRQAVADGSHEIAAIPELLRVLELKGALVTLDATGCQKEIAKQVRDHGGHYPASGTSMWWRVREPGGTWAYRLEFGAAACWAHDRADTPSKRPAIVLHPCRRRVASIRFVPARLCPSQARERHP